MHPARLCTDRMIGSLVAVLLSLFISGCCTCRPDPAPDMTARIGPHDLVDRPAVPYVVLTLGVERNAESGDTEPVVHIRNRHPQLELWAQTPGSLKFPVHFEILDDEGQVIHRMVTDMYPIRSPFTSGIMKVTPEGGVETWRFSGGFDYDIKRQLGSYLKDREGPIIVHCWLSMFNRAVVSNRILWLYEEPIIPTF